MSLKDKVVVITGAASGMGLETARLFASKGAKLSLADIQAERLNELHKELTETIPDVKVMIMAVDVSKREEVEGWVSRTVEAFGKLDGCANLAGVIGKQSNAVPIEGVDDDDWDFIYGVNVIGLRNCLRAQIPHMNEGGSIVNASSILGLIGAANNLAYASSKHAIIGMTRVAAKELGPKKIRCNCFCPGPVDTPMLRNSYEILGKEVDYGFLPLGRTADQKEIPATVEFLISDASSFITGVALPVDVPSLVLIGQHE
ncbi:3-alpha--hydroxysteroid dehydrogenase [Macroventuria anomochaeta]|uniref:3-alpha--hydroxysteroid dehydrogenase n=1 Tax=Macroventuria anomochaeta TaxID=301207 RepID=A0ACB6RNK5_9PLEO|nr:3-alpha--hydroxysteroid dehydrogenase [Macroventuria anomochaeta]KAF2622887.1 3-alpha--hydroxysteroid dehydrogenase [Macroventuria anomochaeta]